MKEKTTYQLLEDLETYLLSTRRGKAAKSATKPASKTSKGKESKEGQASPGAGGAGGGKGEGESTLEAGIRGSGNPLTRTRKPSTKKGGTPVGKNKGGVWNDEIKAFILE